MAEEKEEKKKEKKVWLMNRGIRTFYVNKDLKLTPGDHQVNESIADKFKKDYPKEFKVLGAK